MSKKNTTLQSIRVSTIKHQLKALTSQVEAIKTLDCEHHEGIDLGADPESVNILSFSRRLASRAEVIVNKAAARDVQGVASLLDKMRNDVTYLNEHAGSFKLHATTRADEHLKEMLPGGGDQVLISDTNTAKLGNSSYAQAGLSCFHAETNQFRTFEFQVLALVYLALEIAYFAADEVGVKPITLPAKTTA
ncbi:MAG: hypothetical protein SGJ27_08975 [Candidatus Melainabacteria bacterium]|nr:hypothetical protein [Candidatus Melainabacteria bacterium]